jgi:hypothetical protein
VWTLNGRFMTIRETLMLTPSQRRSDWIFRSDFSIAPFDYINFYQ